MLWPFNKYPGTDYETFNWEWLIDTITKTQQTVKEFIAYNKLTWRGDWDPAKVYPKWSIVRDPETNDGYVSIQVVPQNVEISNREYWELIADYQSLYSAFGNRLLEIEKVLTGEESDLPALPYVTPEMFGAIGDGSADDTAALQTAINDNRPLFMGNTYRITAPLTIPSDKKIVGNMPYSTDSNPKGIIRSDNCDIFRIPAGHRFIEISNLRLIAENYGGIIFTGTGTVTRCKFDNLTMSCRYDITDSYVNASPVNSAVGLWNVEFNNISSYINDNGSNYALYIDSAGRSFAVKFRNFVTGDKSVYLQDIAAVFDCCNFGFDENTKITTLANTYLKFIGCNFEDDVAASSRTRMDLGSTQLDFDSCCFQTHANDASTPWFKFKSSVNSVLFDTCDFRTTGNNNFWLPAGNEMARSGGMKFIGYNNSLPAYTQDYQKGLVNLDVGNYATRYASNSELIKTDAVGIYGGFLAYYNGTKWVGPGSVTGYTPPDNPYNGQLWTNGNNLKTYVWYGNGWFDMTGARYTP